MSKPRWPGPRHRFPEGRFHQTDDGELVIAIAVSRRKVVMEFGTTTKWIAFGPKQARELAKILEQKATEAEGADA